MDYIVSAISVVLLWLMGNKWKYAPIFGIGVQGLWIYYAISSTQYGLLIGSIAYLVVHTRNAIKWIREGKNKCVKGEIKNV